MQNLPKPKPDEVIRHELVMGRSERELLETITTAYTVNKVLSPFATLLSTTAGVLLVATFLLQYLEQYLPEGWSDMSDSQLADWFETQNIVGAGLGATAGGLVGLLFGPLGALVGAGVGAVGGSVATELGEETYADPYGPASVALGPFASIVRGAKTLEIVIDKLQE